MELEGEVRFEGRERALSLWTSNLFNYSQSVQQKLGAATFSVGASTVYNFGSKMLLQSLQRPVEKDTDATRTISEVIASRGHICEEHHVETPDGYILTVHRIVNTRSDVPKEKRLPVLVQHGFTSNAMHWLIASPDGHVDAEYETTSNLGFALAKQGYDVWLGNFRGNCFSLRHKTLNASDGKFWDFCLDELIGYDLPSTIDYILKETSRATLAYVGHSMGTTTMFGLLSSQPEYNDKIKPFIALAPVVRLSNIKTPIKGAIPWVYSLSKTRQGPMWSSGKIKPIITGHIFERYLQRLAHNLLFLLSGFNWEQVDESRLNIYHAHPFGDCSYKNLSHFLQVYFAGHLVRYNYGREQNEKIYGQPTAPKYDLSKITCDSISMFHGRNDWFTAEEDIQYIRDELKVPIVEDYRVPIESWNHLDFMFGKDCGKLVNEKILTILSNIPNSKGG